MTQTNIDTTADVPADWPEGWDTEETRAEGWAIGTTQPGPDGWGLPIIVSVSDAFASDREALKFVIGRGQAGGTPHSEIMMMLREANPAEFWDGLCQVNLSRDRSIKFVNDFVEGFMKSFVAEQPRENLYAAVREWEALRNGFHEETALLSLVDGFKEYFSPLEYPLMDLMGKIIVQIRAQMAEELGTEFAFSDEDDLLGGKMKFDDLLSSVSPRFLNVREGEHGGKAPDLLYINEVQFRSEVLLATTEGQEKVWVGAWFQQNRDKVLVGRLCDGENAGRTIVFKKEHILDFAETSPFKETSLKFEADGPAP